jgi:hypothetical protein
MAILRIAGKAAAAQGTTSLIGRIVQNRAARRPKTGTNRLETARRETPWPVLVTLSIEQADPCRANVFFSAPQVVLDRAGEPP